jgi:hypothetical protein
MKEQPDPDLRWKNLVARAQADVGPSADLPALLRAVREASLAPRAGWATEFSALFATGRILSGCLAGTCALATFASWQAWETWQALPWAQWLAITTGGVP